MNVFSKLTLLGLQRNRTRTIVTIIGVVLSVAMFTAVTAMISSLQHYLLQLAIASDGDWHGKYTGVDQAFLSELSENPEIESMSVVQSVGYALLEGGQNQDKPYLFLQSFDQSAFDTLSISLTEGRLPENGSELVLSEHIRTNGGVHYQVDDVLTLAIGERTVDGYPLNQLNPYQSGDEAQESFQPVKSQTYTVVGFCKRPGFEPYTAPGYTALTAKDPDDGLSGGCDVYFKVKNLSKIYDSFESATGGNPHGAVYNNEVLRASGVSRNETYNALLYGMGGIIIALILFGSVLLIYNSFSISVGDRIRQFGILSSVGATQKQLRYSVLFEGVCIGLAGILLGLVSGAGVC